MLQRAIKHVVCGMSGGVDSAVAALILKKKGYRVTGVFMRNWDSKDELGYCSADAELADAEYVCNTLDIPLVEVNYVKEYWNDVFCFTLKEYENGRTPNPDILCNKKIKFNIFLKHATEKIGADYIATGHYAKSSLGDAPEKFDLSKGVRLMKAQDQWKDQTFFLSQISQEALSKTLFPLGDFTKKVVKEIAKRVGLDKIASKKESMGMCFIGSRKFRKFIDNYLEQKPGNFVDVETGQLVGTHTGSHHFTIGQRANISGLKEPYFVSEIDATTQTVTVAPGTNHPALFSETAFTAPAHWIHSPPRDLLTNQMTDCEFRFQHVHPLVKSTMTLCGSNSLIVSVSQPMRAITPGQYAVFYKGEECLGSAKIIKPGPSLYTMNHKVPVNNPKPFA